MELKVFDMCNDYMFKSEFRSIEARKVFVRFLNEVTGIDINILMNADFQSGELTKTNKYEKGKVSDCIIKISNNKKLIIEMNNFKTKYISKKATSYSYGIITESTGTNNNYPDILLICIDNFNAYNTKKDILTFMARDEDGNIENDLYKSIHIVLENAVNSEYNEVKKFSKFLKMTTIKEMREYFKGDNDYMDAINKVEEYTKDPKFIGYYDAEKQNKIDLNEAHSIGVKEGIEQEARNIAQKLKVQNIDVNIISNTTGLSISEIEEL